MRKFLTTTAMSLALMMAGAAARPQKTWKCCTGGRPAAKLLRSTFSRRTSKAKGITWTDMPVAGGGGTEAMTVLRARVTAGNAPTAVQMLGFDILDWAKEGALGNLDDVAAKEGWDKVIPTALQQFSKYDGHWIAAPVNVHSTNWVWINKAALDKAGGKEPANWDELDRRCSTSSRRRASRRSPMAASRGRTRPSSTPSVLSLGNDFYKQAFIDLDRRRSAATR